jgi:type I restriction enzyme, S subunit
VSRSGAPCRTAISGWGFPNVSGAILADFELVIPPIPEQQRIVGILDEAFEGIAKARANAEKNIQNARALFESYLQSVFTKRGKGWQESTIQELCVIGDGNLGAKYPKKTAMVPSGIPFIRGTNLVGGTISGEDILLFPRRRIGFLRKDI